MVAIYQWIMVINRRTMTIYQCMASMVIRRYMMTAYSCIMANLPVYDGHLQLYDGHKPLYDDN